MRREVGLFMGGAAFALGVGVAVFLLVLAAVYLMESG